ncbi:MBOAT family protein [Parvibaculum sp.]|uniref:MBOAT family O-acyltransferase n=1 Tax=Parvibaculum sp. TaxID=2024848 RepID=UPI00262FB250|nr:MBOAT family protein [Parvibaculum sp.]MCW5729062.1 MBOAT family protein [Parvibaculum sp.]
MLFHSQLFVFLFLPVALCCFYAARRAVPREYAVIALSFVFYGWADIRFVPLLACSILLNWALAFVIREHRSMIALWVGVVANLATIGYFKYKNFFLENIEFLVGIDWEPSPILLPIGISFFTFQQISYLADVHGGRAPVYPLRKYAFYVSYFPQLIAGPIVRHNELIPNMDLDPWRPGVAERIARGTVLFVVGLVKKFAIADQIAPHANIVYAAARDGAVSTADAWTGTLAFTIQIYFDFSAYSDMAIGLAMMMGFIIPANFDAPYKALSIRDFWRRWHMTLSRFLRDYVYIPLGGNRFGVGRQIAAQFITMTLCGLWHGAGWTFLLWGVWHAVGMSANLLWSRDGRTLQPIAAWIVTMLFVIGGWVLFRAETFGAAQTIYLAMFGLGDVVSHIGGFNVWLALAGAVIACFGPTSQDVALMRLRPWRPLAAVAAIGLFVVMLEVGKGQPIDFIYFEF